MPAFVPLALWEVSFRSAGQAGSRRVWAPGAESAGALVRGYASLFGLGEDVTILAVERVEIREQGLDAAA